MPVPGCDTAPRVAIQNFQTNPSFCSNPFKTRRLSDFWQTHECTRDKPMNEPMLRRLSSPHRSFPLSHQCRIFRPPARAHLPSELANRFISLQSK
jgi:hypothetical protein